MAIRKAQDDPMARTQAERELSDGLDRHGIVEGADHEATEAARAMLGDFPSVQFETGVGKTPDGQKIAQRRLVITGPWVVDPNGLPTP